VLGSRSVGCLYFDMSACGPQKFLNEKVAYAKNYGL